MVEEYRVPSNESLPEAELASGKGGRVLRGPVVQSRNTGDVQYIWRRGGCGGGVVVMVEEEEWLWWRRGGCGGVGVVVVEEGG